MLVEVTQKHINEGFKGSCNHCPIARAINEALRTNGFTSYFATIGLDENFEAEVGICAYSDDTGVGKVFQIKNDRVSAFVNAFDGSTFPIDPTHLEPFTFELDMGRLACV